MYEHAKLHVGFDAFKYRLRPLFGSPELQNIEITDLLYHLKDLISTALKHDEVWYVPDQKAWLVFPNGEPACCRFYHLGQGDMYVELFGMFQAHDGSFLNLSESHVTILELLSGLRNSFDISITKSDLSIDYFYDRKNHHGRVGHNEA
jgi:hypothetical protein